MGDFFESLFRSGDAGKGDGRSPSGDLTPKSVVDPGKSISTEEVLACARRPAQWDADRAICATPERTFYVGTAGGFSVLVVVANPEKEARKRLFNEATILRKTPPHRHVQRMLYCTREDELTSYMTFKLVQPAGFDLDCLKNQFAFSGLCVPSTMVAAIFRQLVNALNHLHVNGILHRRMMTRSVLIDARNKVTLSDMSDACMTGAVDWIRLGHVAPEVYEGGTPQGAEVDCWGLGVLLHQIYQGTCDILERATDGEIRAVLARRSAMPGDANRVMVSLLALDRDERWTLEELCYSTWLRVCDTTTLRPMTRSPPPQDIARQYLRKFRSSGRLPAALAVRMSAREHSHIVGKTLKELRFSDCRVNVLLVATGEGTFTTHPGADTVVEKGSWVYFGVHVKGSVAGTNAFHKLFQHLKPPEEEESVQKPTTPFAKMKVISDNFKQMFANIIHPKRQEDEDSKPSRLAELSLEFDCFSFPEHVGDMAVIGPKAPDSMPDCPALDIRRTLGLNLAGIKRAGPDHAKQDVEWFPGPQALVRPGDLGLIVREPDMSGGSRPTLTDDKLEALMNPGFMKPVNSLPGVGKIASSVGLNSTGSLAGSTRLPIASRTSHSGPRPDENSEPRQQQLPAGYEATPRPLRPELPSPAVSAPRMAKAETKANHEVTKANGLSEKGFESMKSIPEVAPSLRPKSDEPAWTKSSGTDSSGLPSFFPALIMPWQRSREESKKIQEPKKIHEPKKVQTPRSTVKRSGIYEEEEPSYEGNNDGLWAPTAEISVSLSARGFYEDEDEPNTARGGIFEDPYSPNQDAEQGNVSWGVYEDI